MAEKDSLNLTDEFQRLVEGRDYADANCAHVFESIFRTLGIAIVGVVFALALAFSDAVHEIYNILAVEILAVRNWIIGADANGSSSMSWGLAVTYSSRAVFSIVGLFAAGYALWLTARMLLIKQPVRRQIDTGEIPRFSIWLPRVLGTLPAVGAAIGFARAAGSGEANSQSEVLALIYFNQFALIWGLLLLSGFVDRVDNHPRRAAFLLVLFTPFFYVPLATVAIGSSSAANLRLLGAIIASSAVIIIYPYLYETQRTILSEQEPNHLRSKKRFRISVFDRHPQSRLSWLIFGFCYVVTFFSLLLAMFGGWVFEPNIAIQNLGTLIVYVSLTAFVLAFALDLTVEGKEPISPECYEDDKKGHTLNGKVFKYGWVTPLVLFPLFLLFQIRLPIALGPIAIASLFVISGAVLLAWSTLLSRTLLRGWPLTGTALVLLALLSPFGLLGDTTVRTRLAKTPVVHDVKSGFKDWLTRREGTGIGEPTQPIVVVAAQGGGLFAAYQTAFGLAVRADEDATFTGRVFAISGVSGGSVGAGIFAAIVESGICDRAVKEENCHKLVVKHILTRDFLSPVLGGMLFYDLFSKPFAWLPRALGLGPPVRGFSDRSRALDRGFEVAARRGLQVAASELGRDDPEELAKKGLEFLQDAVFDSWSVMGGSPALFLNTTDVDTGERIILSPFRYGTSEAPAGGPRYLADVTDGPVPYLSTALGLSARFPLVTPSGRLAIKVLQGESSAIRMADGGYFDNTGLETAREIVEAIGNSKGAPAIHVLIFGSKQQPPPDAAGHGELYAPLKTFVGAWSARGKLTRERLDSWSKKLQGVDIEECNLDDSEFKFTLSWLLSRRTLAEIEDQIPQEPSEKSGFSFKVYCTPD